MLVGFRAVQVLPVHPGPASSFTFLHGEAVMVVGDAEVRTTASAIVVVPTGALRPVRALTDTVFVGSLGDLLIAATVDPEKEHWMVQAAQQA